MKVTLADGRTVYFNFVVDRQPKGNHTTICCLELAPGEHNGKAVITSVAKCHVGDQYNKAKGKVIALERALAKAFPSWSARQNALARTKKNMHRLLSERLGRPFPRPELSQTVPGGEYAQFVANRAARKLIWARFYQTLRTPDMATLSGYAEYIGA